MKIDGVEEFITIDLNTDIFDIDNIFSTHR